MNVGTIFYLHINDSTVTGPTAATLERAADAATDRRGGSDRTLAADGGRPDDSLFEALPDPTVLVEFDGDEGRVVSANAAFEATFDCEAEAIVGEPVADQELVPGLSADAEAIRQSLRDGESVTREVSRETVDGERSFLFRTVPVDGESPRAYGSYTDITERASYEADLAELHELARKLMIAESTEAVLDIGLSAARDILGHEMNSIHLYDDEREALVPAVTTERTEALLGEIPALPRGDSIAWRAYESGEAVVSEDVREDPDVYNDGTQFRSEMILPLGEQGVMLAASPEPDDFDAGDVSLGRVLAATVESALRKVEREETLRNRQAALTRQNERLDEFASVVSHDLRTPLDLAGVHLELAMEDGVAHERLDDVSAAHDRMSDLIDDVLTWAHEGDAVEATAVVSLSALVTECWDERETDAESLAVTTEQSVHADRGRLRQVFDNLIDNALAYGGDGVTVTVGDLTGDDGIFVADDGPGIPEPEREAVFDSGHTLSMKGTGFGLAIVRQIVEAHGWTITLTESADGGARFEIRFDDGDEE